MKIKSIMCNSSKEFYKAHSAVRQEMSTNEVELMVVNIKGGPLSLETALDEALAAPYILKAVSTAEEEGCDAVIIDCAADPVLRAARQISSIPVISAGEASYHAVMMLCDKFTIVTSLGVSIPLFRENIEKYGYTSRLASVRAVNLPVLELEDQEITLKELCKISELAIEKDGAEAIVLGCTGMLLVRDRLQKAIGVPVVEPLTMAIQYAAAMVRAGLSHSRITYGPPSEKSKNILKQV